MSSGHQAQRQRPSAALLFVRYGIAALVVLAGIIAVSIDSSRTTAEGAGGVIGAGLAIFTLNWFFRFGARGEVDRDVEAAARDYYSVHGVWPDDSARATFAKEGHWPDDLATGA